MLMEFNKPNKMHELTLSVLHEDGKMYMRGKGEQMSMIHTVIALAYIIATIAHDLGIGFIETMQNLSNMAMTMVARQEEDESKGYLICMDNPNEFYVHFLFNGKTCTHEITGTANDLMVGVNTLMSNVMAEFNRRHPLARIEFRAKLEQTMHEMIESDNPDEVIDRILAELDE